jgi:SAM-dependent methyltransferase
LAGKRASLSRLLLPVFKPTRSAILPGWGRYLLMRPVPFELWFRARAAWFLITRGWSTPPEGQVEAEQDAKHQEKVVGHNFGHRWLFSRQRTEKLMNVLKSVGTVSPSSRVLCIGPRNEAEILLLSLYGFSLKNIVGVDLQSYSPLIRQMDMHQLEFADNSFDVVYVLYTLPYAYDLRQACMEIVRVLRPDGVVAAGFQAIASKSHLRAENAQLQGGLEELLEHFQPHVRHVFWQETDPDGTPGSGRATTIFSTRK